MTSTNYCKNFAFEGVSPYNAHMQNIHALNSDTHTFRIQYEYTQKQCVGVAIEGMDIWYKGLKNEQVQQSSFSVQKLKIAFVTQ